MDQALDRFRSPACESLFCFSDSAHGCFDGDCSSLGTHCSLDTLEIGVAGFSCCVGGSVWVFMLKEFEAVNVTASWSQERRKF